MAKRKPPAKPAGVGVEELCRLLGGKGRRPITQMRVSQLVAAGMPKIERGRYDPLVCLHWYIGRLRRAVEARETENSDGGSSGIRSERKRLLRAQAEREEIELQLLRGKAIKIEDHERIFADLIMQVNQQLKVVAHRVAPQLIGETDRATIRDLIQKEIDVARLALADSVPRLHPPDHTISLEVEADREAER